VEVPQSVSKERRNDYSSQKKYYKQSVIFKEYYNYSYIVYTLVLFFPRLNSNSF
jgi:hypothetical protein